MSAPLTGKEEGLHKIYVGEDGWMKISSKEHDDLISGLRKLGKILE
ncbi:MAG: hypothetical protein WC428_08010 [Candidatus Paceibacterota bacterium]